ncbi:hypothetical protein H6P81_016456 [Aristolochia fimbriata]|uniref:Uncharacterized protein n=1 Tax=Aristolochia fimbriata TaxID=158543 RepID=A0AAV7E9N2_ARIFI|nr:hypothetical protein H6P81_016456 [Aristolochia fimbriata]
MYYEESNLSFFCSSLFLSPTIQRILQRRRKKSQKKSSPFIYLSRSPLLVLLHLRRLRRLRAVFLFPFTEPSEDPIDGDVDGVPDAVQPFLREGVHEPGYVLHDLLPHLPDPLPPKSLQHRPYGCPVPDVPSVDEDGVRRRVVREVPRVLQVRRPPPEEDGDGAREHAVEDRPPGEAVPARLQAELRVEEELHRGGAIVGAAGPGAVHGPASAGTRRVGALPQKGGAEVVLEGRPGSAGEAEEGVPGPVRDESLPIPDVGEGSGVESGGVGYADVAWVPRVPLDKEPGHVLHPGHVEEAGAPVPVFGAPEIPGDASEDDEVIPTPAGHLPRLLVPDPPQQRLGMKIPLFGGVVGPEVLADGEAGVEGDVEGSGGGRIGGPAGVAEDPAVVDDLGGELVGPVPGGEEGLGDEVAQPGGGGGAEAAVGEGDAAGVPGVEGEAAVDQFFVEHGREVVHEEEELQGEDGEEEPRSGMCRREGGDAEDAERADLAVVQAIGSGAYAAFPLGFLQRKVFRFRRLEHRSDNSAATSGDGKFSLPSSLVFFEEVKSVSEFQAKRGKNKNESSSLTPHSLLSVSE